VLSCWQQHHLILRCQSTPVSQDVTCITWSCFSSFMSVTYLPHFLVPVHFGLLFGHFWSASSYCSLLNVSIPSRLPLPHTVGLPVDFFYLNFLDSRYRQSHGSRTRPGWRPWCFSLVAYSRQSQWYVTVIKQHVFSTNTDNAAFIMLLWAIVNTVKYLHLGK